MKLIVIALLSIISAPLQAEENAPQKRHIDISTDEDIATIMPGLPRLLTTALAMVKRFPPRGAESNVFQWADPKLLEGKTFEIMLATSQAPHVVPFLEMSRPDIEALTMVDLSSRKK